MVRFRLLRPFHSAQRPRKNYLNCSTVIYGVNGLRRVARRKDGGLLSTLASSYWGLVGVGLLSGWYHATLKYHSQMGDDLSMFLAVGSLLHQLLCFQATPSQRRTYTVAILGIVIPVAIYHVWADEIYAHEVTFAVMFFTVAYQLRVLTNKQVADPELRKAFRRIGGYGLTSGLFGYFLWNIDFHLCSHVTAFKRYIGLPWGFIFELHGWWHIWTGVSAYVGMALVEYLVTLDEGSNGRLEDAFMWPVKASFKEINRYKPQEKKSE